MKLLLSSLLHWCPKVGLASRSSIRNRVGLMVLTISGTPTCIPWWHQIGDEMQRGLDEKELTG